MGEGGGLIGTISGLGIGWHMGRLAYWGAYGGRVLSWYMTKVVKLIYEEWDGVDIWGMGVELTDHMDMGDCLFECMLVYSMSQMST